MIVVIAEVPAHVIEISATKLYIALCEGNPKNNYSVVKLEIKNKNSLTQNIHIIINKSNLSSNEANLYLGILSKIEKALQK